MDMSSNRGHQRLPPATVCDGVEQVLEGGHPACITLPYLAVALRLLLLPSLCMAVAFYEVDGSQELSLGIGSLGCVCTLRHPENP